MLKVVGDEDVSGDVVTGGDIDLAVVPGIDVTEVEDVASSGSDVEILDIVSKAIKNKKYQK